MYCIEFVVWFKCQGVQTLSFDESIDGVPQPLSIKQSGTFVISTGTFMSFPGYLFGSPPPVYTRGAEDSEPAPTVPGSASPEGTYSAPPQEAVFSSLIDDLWHRALENYGLQRPTDVTEIHVFRVILQSSWDKNACTRTVTSISPGGYSL